MTCQRPYTGSARPDARCGVCGEPWHAHERAGITKALLGCGLPGHYTAGGPPWDDPGRTYYCGACEAPKKTALRVVEGTP